MRGHGSIKSYLSRVMCFIILFVALKMLLRGAEIKTIITIMRCPLYITGFSCQSTFPSIHDRSADLAGIFIKKPLIGCWEYCGQTVGLNIFGFNHSDVCYGYTFYPATNSCYISTNKDYVLTPQPDAVFYQARITCYSSSMFFCFLIFHSTKAHTNLLFIRRCQRRDPKL